MTYRKRLGAVVGVLLTVTMLLFVSDTRQTDALWLIVIEPIGPSQQQRVEADPDEVVSEEHPLGAHGESTSGSVDDTILHIILAGVDSGDTGFEYGRTDSIILVTLDPLDEKIKLTSFMRDLYVEIPGHGYSKINAAHAWGGMQLLTETLNRNFRLTLDRYVVIDFAGFQSAIDALGGIDIEIKDYEVPHVNTPSAGVQHLSGSQALHFVRLRYAGNSDYERTERQRRVLSALLERVRQLPASDYYRLYREIEPYIRTNFSILETLRIGYISYMLRDAEVETLRIPADGTYESTYRQEMAVLVPDLEANIVLLNDFLRPARDGGEVQDPVLPTEPSR